MCAIAGIFDLLYDDETISRMLKTMSRRGPDDLGSWLAPNCALIHTRLAIRDPGRGHQPMILQWEGETYVLVYNGELYNTEELQSSLSALHHVFRTDSDTEILLHAYAQWGEDCLQRLNGIYSFAVYAQKANKLFLARDRMGVKPLFYLMHKGGLLFSSEIKTILSYPAVEPAIDQNGIAQILLLGPGRIPGSGIFKDIMELEPGWCAAYEHGRLQKRQYWRLTDREHTETFAQTVDHVRWLVTNSIRRQMVSDVPIGTFLSGGLDSSIITSLCAKAMKDQGEILQTFSVDYADNDRYFVPGKFQPNSDGYYIRLMQDTLHTNHRFTVLTPHQLLSALEASTYARDLPGMADVDFSLLLFCADIRQDVKVALSGECADEIFGGYPWFRDPEVRALEGFPWAQNTKYRLSFLHPDVRAGLDGEAFVMDLYRQTINQTDILPGTSDLERRMKEMMHLNVRWFMQTLLDRKDRMSMYSGLEVRVPFCDHRIAEYLYGVPWEYKDYRGREKGLLRYAVTGLLPDEILWRKKSPYPKTWHPQYLELVSSALEAVIEDSHAPIHQIVSSKSLRELLTASYEWPWYGQLMKVPQTIAYMLQIDAWMRHYHIRVL